MIWLIKLIFSFPKLSLLDEAKNLPQKSDSLIPSSVANA